MSRSLVTAFASIAGSRILVIIASAVISPALVFFLTTDQFGEYGSVMAVFSLLMILVSSGINSGVRKYISEERDEAHWQDHVFAYYFRLATGLAVVAAGVLAVGAYTGALSNLLNSDGGDLTTYFYLLALLVVASQFREYVRRALMGLKFEHIGEPLRVLEKISFGVVAVVLAALGYGVVGVLFGLITASLLVFTVGLFFIAKEVRLSYVLKPLPDNFPRKELFHFNHLTIVYVFLLTSMYHIDLIFVKAFIGSTEAGLYKMALVLVQFLWVIPRSIQSVMIQSTSNLWAEGKIDQIQDIAAQSTRYALLITTLLALGLGALASDFVPLYYPSVESPETVVTAILLLLPGTLGFAMARPLLSINHAKGDMKSLIAATGAAAVINLVLNVILIRGVGPIDPMGTQGAAIATSIGYGSLPLFQVWVGRRFGYDPFADVRFFRIVATGIIAAIPIFGLPYFVVDNALLSLFLVPPLGFAVFMAAAIGTGAVRTGEVLKLLGSLPEPIASKARGVERWLDGGNDGPLGGGGSRTLFSVALPIAGIAFFAVGIGFVAGMPGLGLGGGNDSNTTPMADNATPTPTQNGSLTNNTTATPTASPTTAADDTGATPTPTASPTTTDDGGGLFGGGDDDDDGLFGGDDDSGSGSGGDDAGSGGSSGSDDDDDNGDSSDDDDPTDTPTPESTTSTTTTETTTEPTETTTTATTTTTTTTETTSEPTETTTTTESTPTQTATDTATSTPEQTTEPTATETSTATATETTAESTSGTSESSSTSDTSGTPSTSDTSATQSDDTSTTS
ncbi:Membrane protein involved in the export of O-antigen and teichoic acid [Halogranum rubrum]|uniref:Membrane protein involved in the export of O-antigen and teichoic acid n=1 Tax=Halogranum rubrum TaxID=553466 RepID=A0A1I4IHM2_9EURY|nr:oligosaccharide flippase family protein [Halogranum rubrum]SFL53557.1 Membrane protein involved in the export of O-antigen and teichoic acid [Halogranum rubrum]